MAGTNYSDDKIAYNQGVNEDITTQTDPNTIGPEIVGGSMTDLADMLEPYILRINNNALFFGVPAPSNALGSDYDIYYQQTNPINIYRKLSGAWVLQGSLPINFTLPEGNLTVRTSISGFTVTATKGGWVIGNTVYQKATQTQITVTAADLNFGRIDIVYADTSNNILYLTGVAQSVPAAPSLPANTILIDQIIVPSQSSGNAPYLLFGGEDPSASGLNFADSTGLINGGILTINANPALFDVSAGTAFFVDFTDPLVPVKKTVSFGPTSGITVPGLTTSPSSYIGVNGNGQIIQQVTPFTNTQRRSIAILGILIHTNLTTINAINAQGSIILAPADQLHDLMNAIGPLNLTGNKYSAASTNLTIQKTAGTIFKFGANSTDFTNPHVASQPAGNPLTFRYRTRNGEVGGDTTNVIPGSYDNAGTITAVGPSQFTIQHINMFQSGLTRIQYGQNLYSTLADAQAAAFSESFALESNIADNGIFRAYLILRGNSTDLSNTTTCLFLEVPKFGGAAGNAGSALTSANIIAALGYTPIDGPASSTDNAIARYDGITGNVIQDTGIIIADTTNDMTSPGIINARGFNSIGSFTASSGLGRGNNLNNTLVASANSDVLVGLDLNPVFTNGAFTSLSNFGLRATVTVPSTVTFRSIALFRNLSNNSESSIGIQDDTGNRTLSFGVKASASTLSTDFGDNGDSFIRGSQNSPGLSLISAAALGTIKFNINGTFIGRFFSNGNFIIQTGGAFTDAGFKLDVIGNARFNTTSSIVLPVGTTGQRPISLSDGDFRKNNTLGSLEYYDLSAAAWRPILDSNNGIQNQISVIQTGNFQISGLAISNQVSTLIGTSFVGNAHYRYFTGGNSNANRRFITGLIINETGSNVGSNWFLGRHDDTGTFIDTIIFAERSTGNIAFGGLLTTSEKISLNGRIAFTAQSAPSITSTQAKNWAQTVGGVTRMHTIDDAGNTGQTIQSGYGLKMPIRTITATTTLTLADYTVLVDPTSGNITVNLPTAASASGYSLNIKRIVTASNTITIDPSGAETIDGAATFNLSTLNQTLIIQSNGTNWFIISQQ